MKITYYTEVISSWCYWAEPAWATLKAKYEGRVEFDWKLALMDETGLPVSREQLEWFYRRSGTIRQSPFILNSGWYEPSIKEYLAPNLVPLAAKVMGIKGDIPRLAIAHAALREGAQVWKWEVSAEIVSRAVDLHEKQLLELARSPEIEKQARTTTAEFHALQVSQRPVFVVENEIGDKAVFSGPGHRGAIGGNTAGDDFRRGLLCQLCSPFWRCTATINSGYWSQLYPWIALVISFVFVAGFAGPKDTKTKSPGILKSFHFGFHSRTG